MKYKNLTIDDKKKIIEIWYDDTLTKAEKVTKIATEYNTGERTVYDWIKNIQNNDKDFIPAPKITIISDDAKKIHKLEDENKQLRNALNEAKNHVVDSEDIKKIIFDLNNIEFKKVEIPNWINNKTKGKIVPVLCIADTHIGEVVNPQDVNYVNEFNTEIASQRINRCVDDFIDIYKNKFNYEYDGIVLNILGDIITGELHDLKETNDKSAIDQVIFAVDLLETQIRKLHKAFGKVLVNMVSGNHGRYQPLKYTKNNNRYNNSLEKIVYTFIERNISKDTNDVIFNTSPEDVLRYSINGHKFQQEHGDNIKTTGTAIAGPSTSFARAYLKKSAIGVSTNNSFQTLIVGHFHNHYYANGVLVCNSVKGFDTYCASLGIGFSLPGCTSFAVNSHGQIIYLTDLQIRKIETKKIEKSIELF